MQEIINEKVMQSALKLSVIIPVYNEQAAVGETISRVEKALREQPLLSEIIAIDDGSTDGSTEILRKQAGITLISHPYNLGYGSSLKHALKKAQGEWILIIDADGTYPVNKIPRIIALRGGYDMIVGARPKAGAKGSIIRHLAKTALKFLAFLLTGRMVPDLNSGFRLFKKSVAMEFLRLYPERFSFTMTLTLACLTNGYAVKFVPVPYNTRVGRSAIKPLRDFVRFVILIFRIVVYFRPLRFFFLPSLVFVLMGMGYMLWTLWQSQNVTDSGLLLIVTGLQIGFIGFLADLIVKSRA